jgi:voltage-gated potassium channel
MEISRGKSLLPAPVVLGAFLLLLVIIIAGSAFYYFVEGLSLIDSTYFAAMTLTTVGYGDFVPKTDIGKVFTAVYAFMGIGLFFGFAAMISQSAISRLNRAHASFQKNRNK